MESAASWAAVLALSPPAEMMLAIPLLLDVAN